MPSAFNCGAVPVFGSMSVIPSTISGLSGSAFVLERDPTTKAEPDKPLIVDGMTLIDPKTGTAPQLNADGIALDQSRGVLYYHALTARKLYKVKTSDLLNENLTDKELAARVVTIGET